MNEDSFRKAVHDLVDAIYLELLDENEPYSEDQFSFYIEKLVTVVFEDKKTD